MAVQLTLHAVGLTDEDDTFLFRTDGVYINSLKLKETSRVTSVPRHNQSTATFRLGNEVAQCTLAGIVHLPYDVTTHPLATLKLWQRNGNKLQIIPHGRGVWQDLPKGAWWIKSIDETGTEWLIDTVRRLEWQVVLVKV